jgi:hypothetical protein
MSEPLGQTDRYAVIDQDRFGFALPVREGLDLI